jgi:Cdc6-like AAA superfamily ATPase
VGSKPERPEPLDVILVAVSGLPGVGKTTVSGMVAERLGADRLRSDVVRKELYPEPTYDPAETEAVYAELLSRAGDRLGRGDPAVLDATFRRCARRDRVAALADDHGVDARFVRVDWWAMLSLTPTPERGWLPLATCHHRSCRERGRARRALRGGRGADRTPRRPGR